MTSTKVSGKGQITLPKDAREVIDSRTSDTMLVRIDGDAIVLQNNRNWVQETSGIFRKYAIGKPLITDDEIDRVVAAAAVERYLRSFEKSE